MNDDDKPPAVDPAVLESLQTIRTDVTGSIDLEQLEHRLSLTPTQRIEENDRFARFVAIVREAGARHMRRRIPKREETLYVFEGKGFKVSLITSGGREWPDDRYVTPMGFPFKHDDGHGSDEVISMVDVCSNGKSLRSWSVEEFLANFRRLGFDAADSASNDPLPIAAAISYLMDRGRLVKISEFFELYFADEQLVLSDYLPRWQPPLLVWYETVGFEGIKRREFQLL